MRCDARRGAAIQCDVIYLWLHRISSAFVVVVVAVVAVVGVANNEAFVCNCLRLMIALEL